MGLGPGSINGWRWVKLMLGGAITSSELDAETGASAIAGGEFKLMMAIDSAAYRTMLVANSTALAILRASSSYKSLFWVNGYIFGGDSSISQRVMRFAFSTRVSTSLAATTIGTTSNSAVSNLFGNACYIKQSALTTAVNKYANATDTMSTLGTTLGVARSNPMTGLNNNDKGWFCGGWNGGANASLDRITFSTETISAVGAGLTVAQGYGGGANHGDGTKGNTFGGSATGTRQVQLIYSTETASYSSPMGISRFTPTCSRSATTSFIFSNDNSSRGEKMVQATGTFSAMTNTLNNGSTDMCAVYDSAGETFIHCNNYYIDHYAPATGTITSLGAVAAHKMNVTANCAGGFGS